MHSEIPIPGKLVAFIAALMLCCASLASAKGLTSKPKPAAKASSKQKIPQTDIYLHPKPAIDSARVHKLYLGGDFDEAIELLEESIKGNLNLSHGDSVFFCKHLGVMYAATYETREKGKYYMHLLLTVEPTARILDMYASDMIYMIFKNIQEEFEATRYGSDLDHSLIKTAKFDSMPVPKTPPQPSESKSSNGHALVWVGATTVAVAAGVGAYFLFGSKTEVTKQTDHPFPASE